MSSKKDGFYYVLVAPATYKTENATTKVTVRNINNGDNSLGYGLLFHSNPTPLKQDYAFLIDSKNQKYRIVKHKPQKEDEAVGWTNSNFIKEGSQENVLEVRDEKGSINFYINGNFVTSIRNTDGYKGGVTGVYVGGMSPVGFSNLEIKR
jgi:galactose mutarotase-like enzyme